MDLAVVIPTLDEELSVGGCLDSVGSHEGVEVIVADGGSCDRTREHARSRGARVVTGIRGRGPQLNLGATSASSSKLLFLHADCRLPEGWLPALSGVLDDEDVSLACFRLRTLTSESSQRSTLHRLWLRVFDLRSRGLGLPYGDQGFAVRRAVFEAAGGFPEIPLMEDIVFARSCRRLGRVQRLPQEMQTTARRVEKEPLKTTLFFGHVSHPVSIRGPAADSGAVVWEGTMKTCLVVFGREPVPGTVKGRLAVGIGAKAAARVYAAILKHSLDVARASGARVVLSLAGVPSGSWAREVDVVVEIQRGTDLGHRMNDAFARRFSEGEGRVVMVGSDCPWLNTTHIATASEKLGGADAVLGPATDGGYWLVAQRPPGLAMFARIPWSSPETLGKTRTRIKALGGTWFELEELVDIDTLEDLELVLVDPRTPETLRRRLLTALER